MCQKSSTRWIVALASLVLGVFIDSARAQTAPAIARFEEETDATVLSKDLIRRAKPYDKTPQGPSSEKSRLDYAERSSSKASAQNPNVESRGTKPRQTRVGATITENTRTPRAVRKTAPKSLVVQTSNNVPATVTPNVGLLETLTGMPTGTDHFGAMTNNVDPEPGTPKQHLWPFKDFVIALPTSVGGTFGVPCGFETRCKVEAKFGTPDKEVNLSTYFTLVDYSPRGLRFYYDKENQTISFSKFSPISSGPIPSGTLSGMNR